MALRLAGGYTSLWTSPTLIMLYLAQNPLASRGMALLQLMAGKQCRTVPHMKGAHIHSI